MSKDFRIYQDGDRQIIERLSYPRFKGVVTFNSPLSDIEDIELLDETRDPSVIAKAMREAGDFLINYPKSALNEAQLLQLFAIWASKNI